MTLEWIDLGEERDARRSTQEPNAADLSTSDKLFILFIQFVLEVAGGVTDSRYLGPTTWLTSDIRTLSA